MTDISLEYLAGYFDADGCVRVLVNKTCCVSVHVQISGRDRRWLEILQDRYGGCIQWASRCWQWELWSEGALAFLEDIEPYARYKRDRIRQAMIAIKAPRHTGVQLRAGLVICEANQADKTNPRNTRTMRALKRALRRFDEQRRLF